MLLGKKDLGFSMTKIQHWVVANVYRLPFVLYFIHPLHLALGNTTRMTVSIGKCKVIHVVILEEGLSQIK